MMSQCQVNTKNALFYLSYEGLPHPVTVDIICMYSYVHALTAKNILIFSKESVKLISFILYLNVYVVNSKQLQLHTCS